MSSVQRKASHKQRGGDSEVKISGSGGGSGDLRYYAIKAVEDIIAASKNLYQLNVTVEQAFIIRNYVESLNVGLFGIKDMQIGANELKRKFISSNFAKTEKEILIVFGKIWAKAEPNPPYAIVEGVQPQDNKSKAPEVVPNALPSPRIEGDPNNLVRVNFSGAAPRWR